MVKTTLVKGGLKTVLMLPVPAETNNKRMREIKIVKFYFEFLFSKRIMVALFDGNPNTSLVINFAPVEGSEEAEEHYLNLSNTASDIPKHHMIIIECGDFNAHIGRNEAKYTYHTETNNNGKMLLAHSEECGLRITNTLFKKENGETVDLHL